MRTPSRSLFSSLTPVRGEARARWTQHLVFLPALILLVGGMSAGGLRSLLLPQHPGPIPSTPVAEMAGTLSEREARQRAAALCARVAGPSAAAAEATLLVIHPGHGRPDRAEWRVVCRGEGGASYSVRLDGRTGELLGIARAVRWGRSGRGAGAGEGDGWAASGATLPLPAARVEALARRYLRSVGTGVAVAPLLLEARPEVRPIQDRLYQGYACTFRLTSSLGPSAPPSTVQPSTVRVDIDARDGSLDALYRQPAALR
jgi:hypothetical protein